MSDEILSPLAPAIPAPVVQHKDRSISLAVGLIVQRCAPLLLRWALGLTLLSAVADRFGYWGPNGKPTVSWGDWNHFVAYTATVNSFLPAAAAPTLAVLATVAELILGVALVLGLYVRQAALASTALFAVFGVAMTLSFGVKAPLNFSVFADAAAAFALAAMPRRASRPRK